MKLSKFNVAIPVKSGYIIYNTLKGSLTCINDELYRSLLDKNRVKSLAKSSIGSELKQLRIIVADDLDEDKFYHYLYLKSKFNTKVFNALAILTYDCNMSCKYCYEKPVRSSKSMSLQTAHETAKRIIKIVNDFRSEEINLFLYGGEPLLNLTPLYGLCDVLKDYAENRDIRFVSNIVTNGTLMTPEVVDKLLERNLDTVQVTIDGSKSVHDSRRCFKNGEGTYNIIMENLAQYAQRIGKVTLRINIDKTNIDKIPEFLEILSKQNYKKVLKITFGIVYGYLDEKCTNQRVMSEFPNHLSMREAGTEIVALWKVATRMGFRLNWAPEVLPVCDACRDNALIFDPYGNLYKCWDLIGNEKYSVGNLENQEFNSNYYEFLNRDPYLIEECNNCQYLPYCNGGCAYKSYVETGSFVKGHCNPLFLQKSLENMIRMYSKIHYNNILKADGFMI